MEALGWIVAGLLVMVVLAIVVAAGMNFWDTTFRG